MSSDIFWGIGKWTDKRGILAIIYITEGMCLVMLFNFCDACYFRKEASQMLPAAKKDQKSFWDQLKPLASVVL